MSEVAAMRAGIGLRIFSAKSGNGAVGVNRSTGQKYGDRLCIEHIRGYGI